MLSGFELVTIHAEIGDANPISANDASGRLVRNDERAISRQSGMCGLRKKREEQERDLHCSAQART